MEVVMKNFAKVAVVGVLTASLLVALPATQAAPKSTSLGTVTFAKQSSTLSTSAKTILNGLKRKIGKSGTITVTGYIQNHAGEQRSLGLARAQSVKTYLASQGVKLEIKTSNAGIPRIGGSTAAARKASVALAAKSSSSTSSTGSYKVTFNLNGKTNLQYGQLPAAQTTTKTKPQISKPLVSITAGDTYLCGRADQGDWYLSDWSATPTGEPVKWTLKPGVGFFYTPTKNMTLYAIWKQMECFFYGNLGSVNLFKQPEKTYLLYTGDEATGAVDQVTVGDFGKYNGYTNFALRPLSSAPVKANMKFVFPDHGSGKVSDYVIQFNSVAFDFSSVPGSFVHDEANGLDIYYYWHQPSFTVQTSLLIMDTLLAD